MTPGKEDRPLVTFFLFAYNQEKYIEEACRAALAQTYSPLEIIFSDDCSTDRTFELMEKTAKNYVGPHQIKLSQNEKNLGLIGHVNKSFDMSLGEVTVIAAGDDISLSQRTSVIMDAWILNGKKEGSFHSSVIRINSAGVETSIWIPPVVLRKLTDDVLYSSPSLIIGASHAWTKSVNRLFGEIECKDSYEDMVIAFRSSLIGKIYYINQPLVRYRDFTGITSVRGEFRERYGKIWHATSASFSQRAKDALQIGRKDISFLCEREALKWEIRALIFRKQPLAALWYALKAKMPFVLLKAVFNYFRLAKIKS